jgi:lipopolysaccharide/colanic/teichoic acid biosynthesis glycosyltransferase
MLDEVAPDGRVLAETERIPPLGAFLRASSLDELPQLVDVLRGRMALVGPRPLYVEYVPLYTPEQARRLLVRPGITGLAQVSGRNALRWEERLALDVHYVDHRSLRLDLRILALTALRVLSRAGVTQEGHATSEMFVGSAPRAGR